MLKGKKANKEEEEEKRQNNERAEEENVIGRRKVGIRKKINKTVDEREARNEDCGVERRRRRWKEGEKAEDIN